MKAEELQRLFKKGDRVELFIVGIGRRVGRVIQMTDDIIGLDTGSSKVYAKVGQIQGVSVFSGDAHR